MKNSTITYGLLGVILSFFLIYFSVLRIFSPSSHALERELHNILQYSQKADWQEAGKSDANLDKSWNRLKYLLALNYAEEDYSLFLDTISRLQGSIRTKDINETVNQSLSALKLWENFKKVVPEP